jgi:hypothetical protein
MTDDRYAQYGAPPETGPPYDRMQEWRDQDAKSRAEAHPAFAEAEARLQRAGVRPLDSIRRTIEAMVRAELDRAKEELAADVRREIDAKIDATLVTVCDEIETAKRQLHRRIDRHHRGVVTKKRRKAVTGVVFK